MFATKQTWFCFILSKWILNFLSTRQSQSILKFLFKAVSNSAISLCWYIIQVSSAYSNSSQSISFIYKRKWVVLKWILGELCMADFKALKNILNINYFVHCVKIVRIRRYSGPHFSCIFPHSDWIPRDTEYLSIFSLNARKCGKNTDQNISEYGLFLGSGCFTREFSKRNFL